MSRVYLDPRPRKGDRLRFWYLDFVGLDGVRVREKTSALTKDDAVGLLAKKMTELSQAKIMGHRSIQVMKPKMFTDFVLEEYLPHCQATHTAKTYKADVGLAKAMGAVFGKKSLRDITSGDIQKYVDRAARTITRTGRQIRPGSVNKRLMWLSGVFSEAEKREYIDRNPIRGRVSQLHSDNLKLRWLSEMEEARTMAMMPEFLKPIVTTALHTGMRLGEIQTLKWTDLDFDNKIVSIERTKNHKTRYIPMNKDLVQALRSVSPYVGPMGASPYVFTNAETGRSYVGVTAALQRATAKAGVEGICFHTLRHTFASRLAQEGIPLNTIRELLGHGSMQMTLRYAHLCSANHLQAVQVLEKKAQVPQAKSS